MKVEAVFGQIKWNKGYKRFRHKGLDKIIMDFGILAIAFNIGKMINKQKKTKIGRDGMNYKTDKGRKWSFMSDTFIICWINHKKFAREPVWVASTITDVDFIMPFSIAKVTVLLISKSCRSISLRRSLRNLHKELASVTPSSGTIPKKYLKDIS